MTKIAKCGLCGEPMPVGEEMFQYHGYSGDCPKPPQAKSPAEPAECAGLPEEPKRDVHFCSTSAEWVAYADKLKSIIAAKDGEIARLKAHIAELTKPLPRELT